MWKNYFQTLLQQVRKFRSTYLINLAGLSFGLACCLVCFLHIRYEYSFDRFHSNGNQLYRLITGDPATSDSWVKMAPPISPKLKAEIPEVEGFSRLSGVSYSEKVMVEYDAQSFLEPHFMMADPSFFLFFDYPLIQGDRNTVLSDLNNVVISETVAAKLFGKDDPIGKTIKLKDNQLDFTVSGIFKDLPDNTHLRCNYLISFENLDRIFGKGSSLSWGQYNYFAYLKLHASADRKIVESKIRALTVQLPDKNEVTFDDFHLQPVASIHFEHNRGNLLPSYDVRYLYVFATLAFSVLIICFMNYFNITSMLSMKRIKEIGVRKSVGATNQQLNAQFILESVSLSLICLLLAILIVEVLSPVLSSWLGGHVEIKYKDPFFILFAIGLFILLAFVSGGYLTTYVNRFKPGAILKGAVSKGGKATFFQHSLLFIQFSLSIILLISSTVIVRQMRFLQHKDLGFDKDQVINVMLPKEIPLATLSALKSELTSSTLIDDVAFSNFVPGRANWNQTVWWEGQIDPESMFIIDIGKDFIPAMKIKLLEGTEEELRSASEVQYLINETALRQIGWDSGKGKILSPFGENSKKPVLGVVKDFNYRSLHNEIAPLVLVVYPERHFSQLSIRLAAGNLQDGIRETERIFKATTGGLPFEFGFMDDSIDKLYEAETRMENIVVVLTAIAIGFALLGIYTLLSFSIENRIKEVAIRKVLGISSPELIGLFVTSYFKIVALASLVAIPVGWKILNDWLTHFNDHVQLNMMGFLGVLILMVGLVTIVGFSKFLSLKEVSPATSLKND